MPLCKWKSESVFSNLMKSKSSLSDKKSTSDWCIGLVVSSSESLDLLSSDIKKLCSAVGVLDEDNGSDT